MSKFYLKKVRAFAFKECKLVLIVLFFLFVTIHDSSAQNILFDFDNAPLHTSLPLDQTVSGITAHFSATGQGFSIQDNSSPVVPLGFTGRFIYPNSIYLADLLINFDQMLTDFSIWYSCQELGCDDAATMRVTAFRNGILVGTNTKTATNPGTWPVDSLKCNFTLGFDSVVVHYDSHPPTCQDYGVIFLADNMRVTPINTNILQNKGSFIEELIVPNPISASDLISISLFQPENINICIYDITGKFIKNLFDGTLNTGEHKIGLNIIDSEIESGLYLMNIKGKNFSRSYKLQVIKP